MSGLVLRGTPIYATCRGERIALVPEVRVSSKPLSSRASGLQTTAEPSALYVIDRNGVKRVAFARSRSRWLLLLALSCLLAPALNWLVHVGKKRG
jgi:hypothetical protein